MQPLVIRFRWIGSVLLTAALVAGCGSDVKPNYSSVPVVAAPSSPRTSASGLASSSAPVSTTPATSATAPITTGPNVRPGESPPTLPASAQQRTAVGATFVAAYWMRTLDWAYATMDTSLAKTAFAAVCTECSHFLGGLDELRIAGGHVSGGRIAVYKELIAENDGRNGAEEVSDVTVNVDAEQTIDGSGAVTGSEPAYPNDTYRVWTAWQGNGWWVVAWKEVIT